MLPTFVGKNSYALYKQLLEEYPDDSVKYTVVACLDNTGVKLF